MPTGLALEHLLPLRENEVHLSPAARRALFKGEFEIAIDREHLIQKIVARKCDEEILDFYTTSDIYPKAEPYEMFWAKDDPASVVERDMANPKAMARLNRIGVLAGKVDKVREPLPYILLGAAIVAGTGIALAYPNGITINF